MDVKRTITGRHFSEPRIIPSNELSGFKKIQQPPNTKHIEVDFSAIEQRVMQHVLTAKGEK